MNGPYRLSRFLAGLMVVQALTGIALPAQYRDPEWIKAAWFANDWLTLVVAVPLLLLGLARATRQATAGTLLWLGTVCYAVYNYAYYMLGAALNVFFLLYVAAFVIAVVILILAVPRIAIEDAACLAGPTAARLAGGYFALTGIALAAVWTFMSVAHVYAGWATPIPVEAFKLVAALDLSIMVPPLTAGGIMLWHRHPWGLVVAPVAGIQAALYLLVLTGGSLVAVQRGLVPTPGEVPLWGTLAIATAGVVSFVLLNAGSAAVSGDHGSDAGQFH